MFTYLQYLPYLSRVLSTKSCSSSSIANLLVSLAGCVCLTACLSAFSTRNNRLEPTSNHPKTAAVAASVASTPVSPAPFRWTPAPVKSPYTLFRETPLGAETLAHHATSGWAPGAQRSSLLRPGRTSCRLPFSARCPESPECPCNSCLQSPCLDREETTRSDIQTRQHAPNGNNTSPSLHCRSRVFVINASTNAFDVFSTSNAFNVVTGSSAFSSSTLSSTRSSCGRPSSP